MPLMTSNTSGPSGYVVATMQSAINTLIASMKSGMQITASSVATINTAIYDVWRTHTHAYNDLQGKDTFGNLPVYGAAGQYLARTSGAAFKTVAGDFGAISTAGITSGATIDAADINIIVNAVNNIRTHKHAIVDTKGTTSHSISLSNATLTRTTHVRCDFFAPPYIQALTFQNNGQLAHATDTISGQWSSMVIPSTIADDYEVRVTKISQTAGTTATGTYDTWLNLGTNRMFTISSLSDGTLGEMVIEASIREVATGTVLDTAQYTLRSVATCFTASCFPAGSKVLMANGSWKLIEKLNIGDAVMGMDGNAVFIEEMDTPVLGERRLMTFTDGSLSWSEEHAMWTKDDADTQWWWSAGPSFWKAEAAEGHIGGLFDNDTLREGDQAKAWAHISGWRENEVVESLEHEGFNTKLYLPRTNGSPIIVNGYVVGAGVNQYAYDYTKLDWNVSRNLIVAKNIQSL